MKVKTPADELVRAASRYCEACGRTKTRGQFLDWVEERTTVGVNGHYVEYQICRACRKAGRRPTR